MQDLTTGSVTAHLVKTTSYMLVSMVFQTLYILVDLYWVGRLGTNAVAAVAISGNLMFLVLAATQMLGVGTTTLVSHAAGRRDQARANAVFNQAQALSVASGLVFMVVTLSLSGAYARAMSADEGTTWLAVEYLAWMVPAMALQFALVAMGAALRGTGNFRPGMIVQTASVILNIVLAPILIFGWGTGRAYGVAGAAMASFIAILVGVAWMATYFAGRAAYLRFSPTAWRPDVRLWVEMLKIGLPAGAEFGLMAIYLAVVYTVIRPFGASAQAGFGIGLRIMQSGFLPIVALGFAVAPVAGQNFGARKPDRVRATFQAAALIATSGMVVFALLAHVAPAALIGVFSDDPAVIAVGDEYLRISSWNFVASGLIFVTASMFQAMGNTLPSLVTSFTRLLVVAVPAFLLSRAPGFELRWIWYLSVIAVALQMSLNLLVLRREFRLRLAFTPSEA
ncbi:MAG: MATE family efflux transporter [Acidobacteria bacterium]|nr:MATE family efflux transporter [Acidobacteriota bacterium]